ncbi:MAG: hypothetical protein ACI4Q4_02460 [Oscillospiraceae bacterium]
MGRYKLFDIDHDRTIELLLTDAQDSELKRFLKDLKNPAETDYKSVLEQYNAICKKLPPATRLTEKRRRAITKAKKEGYDLRELFIKTASSRFLCGENKQGWRASFDWLLIPSNALKVMEGQYDDRTAPQLCPSSIDMDETMSCIKNRYRNGQ